MNRIKVALKTEPAIENSKTLKHINSDKIRVIGNDDRGNKQETEKYEDAQKHLNIIVECERVY